MYTLPSDGEFPTFLATAAKRRAFHKITDFHISCSNREQMLLDAAHSIIYLLLV